MINAVELTGNKFIAIIDEWDAPIREIPDIQKEYLKFLRTLFKSSGTTDKIFAAAYDRHPSNQEGWFTDETIRRVRESDRLIYDTVHGNADAVAAQIEKIHAEETAIGKPEPRSASFGYRKAQPSGFAFLYNDEQALRSVIKLAYFSYKDHYLKFEELPAGDGYADIVYLPKKDSMLPALVIEMKWNKSAEGAIAQIKEKRYPDAVKGHGSDVLLVGINYDKDAPAGKRKHECVIERMVRA